jgi:sulfide dehydrogenase [flavocytochrome c] flavoprotein subunit
MDYRPAKKVTEVDARSKDRADRRPRGRQRRRGQPDSAAARRQIAVAAGLVGADKNWCPVNPTTFESTIHKGIHVIGDACVAGAMPKSGYSANSEAKACATNIVNMMNGREIVDFSGINTCYSFLSAKEAVEVTGVYKVDKEKNTIIAVPGTVGVSPDLSELEAIYAESWLKNILIEMST